MYCRNVLHLGVDDSGRFLNGRCTSLPGRPQTTISRHPAVVPGTYLGIKARSQCHCDWYGFLISTCLSFQILNLFRTLSSWGSITYKPSAPLLYEVSSHVKQLPFRPLLLLIAHRQELDTIKVRIMCWSNKSTGVISRIIYGIDDTACIGISPQWVNV